MTDAQKKLGSWLGVIIGVSTVVGVIAGGAFWMARVNAGMEQLPAVVTELRAIKAELQETNQNMKDATRSRWRRDWFRLWCKDAEDVLGVELPDPDDYVTND